MHYAAFEGHEAVVTLLLNYGARTEIKNMVRRAP